METSPRAPLPSFQAEVRPPWPDEIWRVKHFLPGAFLYDANPRLGVAVRGRAERLAGVSALSMAPLREYRSGWLCLRVDECPERLALMESLTRSALDAAWEAGAEYVGFGQSVGADTPNAALLQNLGFVPRETHEIYKFRVLDIWPRLDHLHRRLRAGGLVPAGAKVLPLQSGMLGVARQFLSEHMPQSMSALALETSGYRPGESLALWVDGEMKGLLLRQSSGKAVHIALRVVASELRGGLAWANLLLIYASSKLAVQNCMEWSFFELNPDLHEATRKFAQSMAAELVRCLLLFHAERPKNVDCRQEFQA